MPLAQNSRTLLLKYALDSIQHGLLRGKPLAIGITDLPDDLRVQRATFVTLEKNKQLRGCIGMLQARYPLAVDVANNAFSAAFQDPRFAPVVRAEIDELEIHIAILSPPEPLPCSDEQDLLTKLRPGTDGLIIADGWNHATFLPSVWDHLPDPKHFVAELKMKAGLPSDHWSKTFRVQRYTTESIP